MNEISELGLFCGYEKPTPEAVWSMYENGKQYNTRINHDETIKTNENFYVGKQWEGVESNGLPTITMNFLKRTVGFTVANVSAESVKVNASLLDSSKNADALIEPVRVLNEEFERITEMTSLQQKFREATRNAAVDGDGCLYTYWDDNMPNGYGGKGAIQKEVLKSDMVFFGNVTDRDPQTQPYMIIARREMLRSVKVRAKKNGVKDWPYIKADNAVKDSMDEAKIAFDDFVTVLFCMWRDDETGTIWGYECTETVELREAWDMEIRRYPVCWLNWDYVADSYHGQAMITGLIPNQIAVNKLWSMTAISLMRTAFPKVIYDKTRIKQWDNRVGGAIPVNGGDVATVAKILDPAMISPQVSQILELLITQTQENLGATAVALGDTRPDNTSALVTVIRQSLTPHEVIKQNLYEFMESSYRIDTEYIKKYYGIRNVDYEVTPKIREIYEFAGVKEPDNGEVSPTFDFSIFENLEFSIKLDVGASSQYSEITSLQTLGNMCDRGQISPAQFIERVPDGYIAGRRKLLNELKAKEKMEQMMSGMMPVDMMGGSPALDAEEAPVAGGEEKMDIQPGRGYNALARKVNEQGSTAGLV